MNLDLFKPRKVTDDLLLSVTKNCETFIDQTYRKTGDTWICNYKIKTKIFIQPTFSNRKVLDDNIIKCRSV